MVSDIGNQVADIVRTQSDLDGLKAAIAKTGMSLQGLPEKERLAKLAALRDMDVYKKVTENTGTGSDVQRAITAATAAVSGLAGSNLNAALAGAAAPYIANEIGRNITDQNTTAGIMAHAVVNAVLTKVQGQDALTGASGAVVGESMGILLAKQVYGKSPAALTDTEKQTIAALSTLASGLAGALAGNSTEATATAAKAGQTTVENNALYPGDFIPPRVQQDSYLAVDLVQKGKSYEEIDAAIEASHMGPSWGPTYKVKTNGKVEVSGGIGPAFKGEMKVDNDSFSVSTGYTKEFGVKAGASVGIDFGPYAPGVFGDLSRDYSASIGFGPGSLGLSIGKDGFGFAVSVGPSIGYTSSSTSRHDEKIYLNSDTSEEIYHHDFK